MTVAITEVMSQSFADGNQDIAADAIPLFTEIFRMHRDGPPTEDRKREFLASFTHGQAELRMAAAKQLESFEATDPYRAQQLQFESNRLLTIHEQTVVDDDLSFRQLAMWERVGARLASSVENCVTRNPARHLDPYKGCDAEAQSGGEILTDTGALTVQTSDTERLVIPLDEIYVDGDRSRNLFTVEALAQVDVDLSIEGLPDLLPVGAIEGVRSDPSRWIDDDGNLLPGSDWSVFDHRMPQIVGFL